MAETTPAPRGLYAIFVAVVLFVCFLGGLNNLGLVGPDEPRYAAVARNMAESGDWVTPRLDGEPWFEKPILYYWGAAAAFRVLGVNEFAARLPSALMAVLATLALAALARRVYGPLTGQFLLLMMPTCVGIFGFARAATTDMLFSGSLALAMAGAAVLVGLPAGARPERYWLFFFGGALGLAALAKGPAAIVLAGGSMLLWMVSTRRWRESLRLARPEAVIAFAVVALPWYVECALRNPDFVRVFFVAHNFERYLTPTFQHEQPVWFYGPILLLGLLPWTVLLAGTFRDGFAAWRAGRLLASPSFFFACWVIFPVAFFTFSKSKLPGYVLPAIPALALLLSRSLAKSAQERGKGARWLTLGVGATSLALALSAGYWLRKLPPDSGWNDANQALAAVAGIAMAGIVVGILGLRRQVFAGMVLASVVMAATVGTIVFQVLPELDAHLSPRVAAHQAMELERSGETIQAHHLHRAWHYGLNFYLRRPVAVWDPQMGAPALLCTSDAGVVDLLERGFRVRMLRRISRQAVLVRVEPQAGEP